MSVDRLGDQISSEYRALRPNGESGYSPKKPHTPKSSLRDIAHTLSKRAVGQLKPVLLKDSKKGKKQFMITPRIIPALVERDLVEIVQTSNGAQNRTPQYRATEQFLIALEKGDKSICDQIYLAGGDLLQSPPTGRKYSAHQNQVYIICWAGE